MNNYQLTKSSLHYTGKVFWDLIQTIKAYDLQDAIDQIHQKGIFTNKSSYGENACHIGSTYGYKLQEIT